MRERVRNELIYEPMEFLQTEADFKKYLHFLSDRSTEQEKNSENLARFLLIIFRQLASYMMISPESFQEIFRKAKEEYNA